MSKEYPFPDDWSSTPGGIRAFVKRHELLISLTGALIVFLTFIVKDAVKEDVKDEVDSLQAAENVFRIRGEEAIDFEMSLEREKFISARLENMGEAIEEIKAHINKEDDSHSSRIDLDDLVEQLKDNANVLVLNANMLDHLKRLIEKLPDKNTQIGALHTLEEQYRSLLETHGRLNHRVVQEAQLLPDPILDAMWKGLVKTASDAETLRTNIETLSFTALQKSVEAREQKERSLRLYSWISYGLYAVGWCMALVGRLYGLDVLEE